MQALFNVLNRSPTIPEKLSAEGKDFLGKCFQRNPADRPTAVQLLDHPFVRNKQDQVSSCRQEFSGLKLHVSLQTPLTGLNFNIYPTEIYFVAFLSIVFAETFG